MKIKHQLIILTALIAFTSCQSGKIIKEESKLFQIDVPTAIENQKDIPLSEIAESITYIPLETRTDILIGEILQIEMTESFIFICESDGLQQFTHEGKFIRQIGGVGRGPGEYNNIMRFTVNEIANTIIVQSDYALIWYDINGNYIKSDNQRKFSTALKFYNPTRLVCNQYTNIENPTSLIIWDINLLPLYKFVSQNPPKKRKFNMSNGPLYVYDNNLYFKENYNDTLYCIKDSLMIPYIVYKEKNLLLDKDFDINPGSDLQDQLEKTRNKLIMGSIRESTLYVFTSYNNGIFPDPLDPCTRILFNKSNYKTIALSGQEFINNLDCGFDFWPSYKANALIDYKEAFNFMEHIKSEKFKNSTPLYPEKKKQLEQLASSLDESDNPVLMLVKLKE